MALTNGGLIKVFGAASGGEQPMEDAVKNVDYQGVPAEGAFVDGDKTKLDGIATGADVTADNAPQAHVSTHQKGGSDPLVGDIDLKVAYFSTSPSVPGAHTPGAMYWDTNDGTLVVHSDITDSVLQMGQELWLRIVNKTGVTLNNGQVVYISGAQGNRPTVALADADLATSDKVIGVVTTSSGILNNAEGLVTVVGLVRSVDTTGANDGEGSTTWTAGTELHVSWTTAGSLTSSTPPAGKHHVRVGITTDSTANGTILVAVRAGVDLNDIHDVSISSPIDGQALTYEAASGLWKNATPAGSGNVSNTGTPLNNQLAVWTDATTIEGEANLTYDGTTFAVDADVSVASANSGVDDVLFVDQSADRVGVGTSSPAQALDVVGNIAVSGTVDGRDIATDGANIDLNTTHRGLTNNPHSVIASQILSDRIAGSTYSTVQHMQDIFHSAGVTTGGGITDDTDGTITVAAGTGLIRATNDDTDSLLWMDWAAESGANVALTDNDMNYVYVEYNAGSPRVVATITKRTEFNTNVFLGTVYREGTTLHITENTRAIVGDHALQMILRAQALQPFARESGGVLGETGTREITITAGVFWEGLTQFSTPAIDTSGSIDTFTAYYRDGVGGWTAVISQTQINNTQYDDGTGTLATLTANRYGVHWIYIDGDGEVYSVFGQGDYTLIQAEEAGAPASLPPFFDESHARIIGKIIIQKSASSFTEVLSAFTATFSAATATDHGDLLGLNDDDHTQYLLISGARKMQGDLGVESDNSGVDDVLFVDASLDRVGIGTSTPSEALDVVGNIAVSGTVDGRDVATDGTKLDGIGAGADVVGPASATDNAFARYDLTTGKLIQNSQTIEDDAGNLTVVGTVDGRDLATDGTKLDTIATGADVTGSNPPQAHAASHTNGTDDIQDAGAVQKGLVNIGAQTFGGVKTFSAQPVFQIGIKSEGDVDLIENGPELAYWDTSQAVLTRSVYCQAVATDLGAGTEDADYRIYQKIAGADVALLLADADGNITFDNNRTLDIGPLDVTGNIVVSGTVDGKDIATLIASLVEDTTPQLGGMLDVNGNAIGDGTLELLTFTETGSAVNQLNITNAITANDPILGAAGDDANIGVSIQPKGTGNVTLGNFVFDADQTVGAGQDNYVLTYDNGTGLISLESAAGGGNVSNTGTPVDNQIAIWTNATTIEGVANVTYDGTTFALDADLSVASANSGVDDVLFVDQSADQVGIGTSTPSEALDVVGNVEVNGQIATPIPATLTPTGTTQTVDWDDGSIQVIDLESASGDVTLTLSNPISGGTYMLKFQQAGNSGATYRDVVLPSTVLLPGGSAPTTLNITEADDASDTLVLTYDGTNYLAQFSQNYG